MVTREHWGMQWTRTASSLALMLALWWIVTTTGWANPSFLPGPGEVWEAAVELADSGLLWSDLKVSLQRAAVGFLIGSTIEVPVSGLVRLTVNGEEPFAKFSDDALQKMRWRGLRINHDDMHGGTVAEGGAMFLSIQRWKTVPASVETDYIGTSNCSEHRERLALPARHAGHKYCFNVQYQTLVCT